MTDFAVDATNLRLGLRLVLKLQTLQRPMILALNQMDAAQRRGIHIDCEGLARDLGIPVVDTIAVQRHGVKALVDTMRTFMTSTPSCTQPTARVNNTIASDILYRDTLTHKDAIREESIEKLYDRIEILLHKHVEMPLSPPRWQDALDAWVMHPIVGWIILLTVLMLTFQAVFAWASPLIELINAGV